DAPTAVTEPTTPAGQALVPAPGFEPAAAAAAAAAPELATSLAGGFMPAQHPTTSLAAEHAAHAYAGHATQGAVVEDIGRSAMAGEDELMLDAALPAEVETNLHLRRAPLADSVPGAAVPRTRLAEDEGRDERARSDGVHGVVAPRPSASSDPFGIPLEDASVPADDPADASAVEPGSSPPTWGVHLR
ncbi:hypothetical protein AURDEDRAFT_165692, partial [Auricularia subglabra TFB-10046 SS5]